jgi:hypothetical protein
MNKVNKKSKKKSRVRYIERKLDEFDEYEDEFVDAFRETQDNKNDKSDFEDEGDNDYAIAWRRSPPKKFGEASKRELLIQSTVLRKALKKVLKDYPMSFETEEVVISPPYEVIYHNRKILAQYGREADEATKTDIEILLRELGMAQATLRRDVEKLAKNGQITFELLWTLFYPGCRVCNKHMGEEQLSVVAPFSYPSEKDYPLVLWSIDYDGSRFQYLEQKVSIKNFKGSKSITDLEVYPLDNWVCQDGETSG